MSSWEPEEGASGPGGSEKGVQPCLSGRGFEVPLGFRLSAVWAPPPGCFWNYRANLSREALVLKVGGPPQKSW